MAADDVKNPASLLQVLSAEALKLRGTLALWMCLVAPALVVAVFTLQMLMINLGKGPMPAPDVAWRNAAQGMLGLWAFLMLPLFVTLQAALLGALEHGHQQWKHLLALSTPRRYHYLAKLLALAGMLVLAGIALTLLCVAGGWLLQFARPAIGIAGPPPWRYIIENVAATTGAAMLIVALHTWMAMRWRSFTTVVAVGMGATVAGFLIGQSKTYGHFFPWMMPMHAMVNEGAKMPAMVLAGVLGGTIIALLGLYDFMRREHG